MPLLSGVLRPALLLGFFFASLQASGQIVVRINDSAPRTIAAEDLAKLSRHTAALGEHGQVATYEGALMHDVLTLAGIDFGQGLRGKPLSTYVKAIAGDGYQVIFALAEFDPTIVDSGIIVADKRDGKPLAATEGPLRLIVPNDKRAARSAKLLKEIDVVQLNR